MTFLAYIVYYTDFRHKSLAHGTAWAFWIFFLDILENIFEYKSWIFDGTSIWHNSIFHCLIDNLNFIKIVHDCSSKDLIVWLPDVVSNKFHLTQIPNDVNIVPALSHSCKNQRVVELPGPEERDVINRKLLPCHIETSYRPLVDRLVPVFNSGRSSGVPIRIGSDIPSCIHTLFICLKEDVCFEPSFLFL